MEDSRISRLKIINIIAILGIFVLSVVLLYTIMMNKRKQAIVDTGLKAKVLSEASDIATDMRVMDYLTKQYAKAESEKENRKYWSMRLSSDSYKAVHIGMWNPDDRVRDWYELYFGEGYECVDYLIQTPKELQTFLFNIIASDNKVDRIILYIDPYELYRKYLDSFRLSEKQPLAFSQMFREYLLDCALENPEISFSINLPILSQEYWLSYSSTEIDSVLECWNDVIHYCGWGDNVKVHALGLEKWIIYNRSCFEGGNIKPDVEDLLFAYENTDNYLIDHNDADAVTGNFKVYLSDIRKRKYDYYPLGNYEYIFFGDSIIDYGRAESMKIPGVIEGITGVKVKNLALSGTTMGLDSDVDSFAKVAKRFVTSNEPEADVNYVFVVEYGFNDFINEVGTEQYLEGLEAGVEELRKAYVDSKILLLSPLRPKAEFEEKRSADGEKLMDYGVAAYEYAEEHENVYYHDIYHSPVLNQEKPEDSLADGVHPKLETAFGLGTEIADSVLEMIRN